MTSEFMYYHERREYYGKRRVRFIQFGKNSKKEHDRMCSKREIEEFTRTEPKIGYNRNKMKRGGMMELNAWQEFCQCV